MQMGYASDRFNINSQLKHLQAKYVGTGNMSIQRDSYASYVGYYPVMSYFAIAENESIGRERYNFMQAAMSFIPSCCASICRKLVDNTCGLVNELSYISY
ncbi:hypothetical protein MKX01_041294 [Papaver californicum]|nr:hypothetical protein MKX01_041294 [Papaver californicum]